MAVWGGARVKRSVDEFWPPSVCGQYVPGMQPQTESNLDEKRN